MDNTASSSQPVTPPPFKAAEKAPSAATSTGQPLPPQNTPETSNNPFTVAIEGISALFRYAKSIAITIVVLSAVGFVLNAASSVADVFYGDDDYLTSSSHVESSTPDEAYPMDDIAAVLAVMGVVFVVVFVAILVISIILYGIADVASAAAANKQTISFGETFSRLFKRLPGYIGLRLLMTLKVFLWSLLFIVPGVIMAVRYSLAGTAYFARDMKAVDALNYSTKITKGGWMTTFASYGWFNIITLGFIQFLVETGVRATLFRQFDSYEQAGQQKPGAHGLSLAFTILIAILAVLMVGIICLGVVIAATNFS